MPPNGFDNFSAAINTQRQQELDAISRNEDQVQAIQLQETIVKSFQSLVSYLEHKVSKTEVVNQLREIGTPDVIHVVRAVDNLHQTLKTHENTDLTEITKVMTELLDEAKKLPKEINIPEQKVVDHTKQFDSLTKAIQAVEKVVKAQKLVAEAPIVNVPKTDVHVDAPDLKPLQYSIKEVVKAVNGVVIPEYKTDNAGVEKLLTSSNKLLEKLLAKPVGSGGGGGGRATPYQDSTGTPAFVTLTVDGKIPVEAGATSTYQSFNDTTTDTNLVYLGKAVAGSDATDAAWQIKRYNKSAGTMTFADDVTTFTKQWSGRTTYGY